MNYKMESSVFLLVLHRLIISIVGLIFSGSILALEAVSFESTGPVPIQTSMIAAKSDITSTRDGASGSITVEVKITHDNVKDLTITLMSPKKVPFPVFMAGVGDPLKNGEYSTYEVDFGSQDSAGQWTLSVQNTTSTGSVGSIVSWKLKFAGDEVGGGKDVPQIGAQDLDQFGFGPALFLIKYDEEVLLDVNDVNVRGDGTISASGTKHSSFIGIETHYNFTFKNKSTCYKTTVQCNKKLKEDYVKKSGHILSPFVGLFDLENGVNGIAVGVLYGFWRSDASSDVRTVLNIGYGLTVHKNQLVLAQDITEGGVPPVGLTVLDYTERKDVDGRTLTLSASLGF